LFYPDSNCDAYQCSTLFSSFFCLSLQAWKTMQKRSLAVYDLFISTPRLMPAIIEVIKRRTRTAIQFSEAQGDDICAGVGVLR
tara:strand:- start:311 stop:559 length:249 start_codon:yes stop_codon:yes gene_type:complete